MKSTGAATTRKEKKQTIETKTKRQHCHPAAVTRKLPMGRRKKFVNKSDLPDEVIERLARAFYPNILASFQSEEGQRQYQEWLEQQDIAANKREEAAKASKAAGTVPIEREESIIRSGAEDDQVSLCSAFSFGSFFALLSFFRLVVTSNRKSIEENNKSEPVSNWKQVRIILLW